MKYHALPCLLLASLGIALSAEAQTKPAANPPRGTALAAGELPPPPVLPAPTEKVVFRKELLSHHPRIFVDAAGVEALRKKMDDPSVAPMLSSFLRVADEIDAETPPENPKGGDMVGKIGDRLPRIAFAYLVTRKPQYLEGARKWIHAVLSYPKWDTDDDTGASRVTFGMALAYDWLYSDLSPEERQQMETALLRHGRLLLARSAKNPDAPWGVSYFLCYGWTNHTGISTAAMALYDTNPAEMQGWLDYTRSRFQPTYRHLAMDGGYHEGPAAYPSFGSEWLLYYIESLRSISGEDLGDMPFLQNLSKRILDMTMPDGRSFANFGDSNAMGGLPEEEIYSWLGSRKKDGHAEWMRQKKLSQLTGQRTVKSPFALLWFDPSVAPKPPDELPTLGLYPDLGEVVFRSSWKDDAAVVVLRCGPPGGHHMVEMKSTFPRSFNGIHYHPDANSFLFWSDKQWRIGDPAGYTLDKQTHSENVWMVDGKGQRGGGKAWFDPASYFIPDIAQPHLVRVATSPAADYVVGEAAPAYEPACKLTEFRRHLLFVKGDKPFVAVYDRLRASEPKAWACYLHTFGKIDIADIKSFSAAGSPPPGATEGWLRLPSLPPFTTAYGVVLAPVGTTLEAHPLKVVDFPANKLADKGYELLIQPPGISETTWLITVIGAEKSEVTLGGSDQAPSVNVGQDQISWDADGNVTFNGKPIEGNLLSPH